MKIKWQNNNEKLIKKSRQINAIYVHIMPGNYQIQRMKNLI